MEKLNKFALPTLVAVGFIYILFLFSVIPFVSVPTTAITIWAIGFARSIANAPWFSIFAANIGYPRPASISFGLPGVLPTAWLIKLGMSGVDAYAVVFAVYLGIGFAGSAKLARDLGLRKPLHWLAGLVWMTLPILYRHTNFSYLAIGFMLLPTYTLIFRWSRDQLNEGFRPALIGSVIYALSIIFALFMDGYSFIFMLAIQAILGAASMVDPSKAIRRATMISEIVMVIGIICAIYLYSVFYGKSFVFAYSLDLIRGYGIDLAFLAIPTKGLFWFFDTLRLSVERDMSQFFGDDAVWKMTFITPLLLFSVGGAIAAKVKLKRSAVYFLILLIGFYMALGPSIKINSMKPVDFASFPHVDQGQSMEAKYAIGPTGSAVIYEIASPIRVLRASYRWLVVAGFGAWLIWTLIGTIGSERKRRIWVLGSILMIVITAPNFKDQLADGTENRAYISSFQEQLFPTFNKNIRPGEVAFFYPLGNAFLINEIASAGDFNTYNIGGDKNFVTAQVYWPPNLMPNIQLIDTDPISGLNELFDQDLIDVFVIPSFDLFRSAFKEEPFTSPIGLASDPAFMAKFEAVLNDPAFNTTVTDLAIFIRRAK